MPRLRRISAQDESAIDDIATSLIIDPYLGYPTRKKSLRELCLDLDWNKLRGILERFEVTQDYNQYFLNLVLEGQTECLDVPVDQTILYEQISKYLTMFREGAGFKIEKCDRYTLENNKGAKISATKDWSGNKHIPGLEGKIVTLTSDEEEALRTAGKNFSILHSCKNNEPSLLLGTLSFVNSDCYPNAKIISVNVNTAGLQTLRPIKINEEILVKYGEQYFDFCQCKTCENNAEGAFAPEKGKNIS